MAGRRAETTRESRNILIAAATELFTEKGYRQTTFVDIADRSGISRSSITWHFGSKEGLLTAVLDQAADTLFDESPGPGDSDVSPVDYLIDRVGRPAILRTSLLFVTLYAEAVRPDSPIHDVYADLHERLRESVKRWIEDSGLTLPGTMTAEDLALILLGAGIGLHLQIAMAPGKIDADRAMDKLGELFASALRNATPDG